MRIILELCVAGVLITGTLLGSAAFAAVAPLGGARLVWTPERTFSVRGIVSTDVSPDGHSVLYSTVETILDGDKSGRRFHLYRSAADGSGERIELIPAMKSNPQPQWSPDGAQVAFLSLNLNVMDIWVVPAKGGTASPLVRPARSIELFKWAPDGKSIAFIAPVEPKARKDDISHTQSDARVVDENGPMSCLFVKSVIREGLKLPARQVTEPAYTLVSFDWSPDGKSIVFAHEPKPGADAWRTSDISVVHLADGAITSLAHSAAAEMNPLWSPDGQWITYIKSQVPPSRLDKFRVWIVSQDGTKSRELANTADRHSGGDPDLIGWSTDSRSIYFTEPAGTVVRLGALPLDGPAKLVRQMPGVMFGANLNASRTWFGFGFESSTNPSEVFVSDCRDFNPVQVSFENTSLPPVAKTEVIQWKSKDGLKIEGLLTYPVNYQKGKRYPLIVIVHGGPRSVTQQFYLGTMYMGLPLATLAERGYAILRPNYRGSTGYGNEFKAANRGDWGGKDFEDILSGIDEVSCRGVADGQRVGLAGWSYGGYMAAWAVTHTKRFRAASAGGLTCDLLASHFTSAIPSWTSDYFGEDVVEHKQLYIDRSPIYCADRAVTPMLILQGENDPIAPQAQSSEFYHALQEYSCPAEMVIYPHTGHYPFDPNLMIDVMDRTLEWFDKYVRPNVGN